MYSGLPALYTRAHPRYTKPMSASPKAANGAANPIGTLNEKALHAALKDLIARPGDELEVPLDGFVIDIVRGDLLIEIQTRSFSAIKRKLDTLTESHRLRLVYPIAREKWIVKLDKEQKGRPTRRKSPKHGAPEQIFAELVSFPHLLTRPTFSLELLLIEEEEVRRFDGSRGWRRQGWRTVERRLLDVVERRRFHTPADLAALLPPGLDEPFTTANLATTLRCPRRLAQQMAYCLRRMDAITVAGKQGNAILYQIQR